MTEEKIYQDIRTDFENKYANYVVPTISPYDEERKKTYKTTIITIIVTLAIGIISLILCQKWEIFKFGGIFLVVALVAYPISKKNFEGKLKKLVMPVVCGCFPDLKWVEVTQEMWAETNIYKESGLFPDFNDFSYDDCFEGKYNDVGFYIREFMANKETGSGKDKKTQQIFKGVIVTLDMNKNFKGNTILRPHGLTSNIISEKVSVSTSFGLGNQAQPDRTVYRSSHLQKTTLEDVEFNRKFDVYTDDEIEARYLLTTSFMERLNTMEVTFKANKISAAFYQNKFFIALHTNKDLFSLGSLKKDVCDREQFFTMFEEILSIIKLIDHFKLDQKIGL